MAALVSVRFNPGVETVDPAKMTNAMKGSVMNQNIAGAMIRMAFPVIQSATGSMRKPPMADANCVLYAVITPPLCGPSECGSW